LGLNPLSSFSDLSLGYKETICVVNAPEIYVGQDLVGLLDVPEPGWVPSLVRVVYSG